MKRSDQVALGAFGILAAWWAYNAMAERRCETGPDGRPVQECPDRRSSSSSGGSSSSSSSGGGHGSSSSSHTTSHGGFGSTGHGFSGGG